MIENQQPLDEQQAHTSLIDRKTTIVAIDTVFDPHKDSFDHIHKIEKDADTYIKTLSMPLLRVALARIVEKNPNILMSLMNNFAENFPGWIYRERFYNPETAKLPRTNRSDTHTDYFRSRSADQQFASIDSSMKKHGIDPQTLLQIREDIKNQKWQPYASVQNEILKHVHPVFVDLLEEWYSRTDLRA